MPDVAEIAKALRKAWCGLFGHAMPSRGWWGDGLYGAVVSGGRDGIGRTHFSIKQTCPRCGMKWTTARFHGEAVRAYLENSDD